MISTSNRTQEQQEAINQAVLNMRSGQVITIVNHQAVITGEPDLLDEQEEEGSFNMTDEAIDEILTREIEDDEAIARELFEGDYKLEVSEWFYFTREEEDDDEGMENFEERMWARFTLLMATRNNIQV
jgi:hypothetical protein